MDNKVKKKDRSLLIAISVGIIMLLVQLLVSYMVFHYFQDWKVSSDFGQSFGVVNTAFAGIAFAGLLYTILIQKSELKSQGEEIERTINLQIQTAQILSMTAKLHALNSLLESENREYDRLVSLNVTPSDLLPVGDAIKKISNQINDCLDSMSKMSPKN